MILALEEAGELPEPVERRPNRGDCTDATGQDWDVKRPQLQQSEASESQVNPRTTYQDVFVWDVPAGVHAASVTINSTDASATVNVRS